jgi:hypothetical protein
LADTPIHNSNKEANRMATRDGFRLVPSDQAEITAQLISATAWRGEMIRAAMLGASAAAIALAFVSFVDPSALMSNATALLASISQDGSRDSKVALVPIFRTSAEAQSSAGTLTVAEAQASPSRIDQPAANDAPTNSNVAAPVKTAGASQAETGPSADEWLNRFQTWAARDVPPPQTEPAPSAAVQPAAAEPSPTQPVQETQAKPAADSVKTAVQIPRVRDARAEIEPEKNARAIQRMKRERAEARAEAREKEERKQAQRARTLRREQHARLQSRPSQDAQDQAPPAEQPRPPTFLESIGIYR